MNQINFKNFVKPEVFLVGYTTPDIEGIKMYLAETDQKEFLQDIYQALEEGVSGGEIICSMYAKLCYASLTSKKNDNISKTRSISDNVVNTIKSLHGSVFEHCNLNFIVTDCSRIYTHEQVRHRVGTAYSQTSGRYVRSDSLKVIIDPILSPIYDEVEECRQYLQDWYNSQVEKLGLNEEGLDFDKKKKLTSALRRMMPNGQANEIGVTENLRTLRKTIEARTSRHAEWEIRLIYNKIVDLVKYRYPLMFHDLKSEFIDGLVEYKFGNKDI
jgi:thymidylate synthase (FAD)